MLRAATLIVLGLGALAWLSFVVFILFADSVPRSEGSALVTAFVAVPSATFCVFALPATILAVKDRFMGLSLTLALLALASVVLVA